MKYSNIALISSSHVNANIDSQVIDCNQLIKMSAQVIVGAGTSGGSLQFQVSNDLCTNQDPKTFVPTNWSSLGSAISVSAAGVTLVAQQDMCYRWLRASYSDTVALVNSITTVADVAGSLNSKYFLINSPTVGYYVWMNINSAGVNPMVAGRTGIEVTAATGATADQVADAVASALDALAAFAAPNPGANIVACTNAVAGPATPAADSVAAPTGFSFASNDPTASISVNLMVLSV